MKIIFMGTPDIAIPILEALRLSKHSILAVVTKTDKAQGRSSQPISSAVKKYALNHFIDTPLLQPISAKDPLFIHQIEELKPDVIIVVAYGQILTQQLLDIPKRGSINVHFSLLPLLRGAAPIQRAILQGYKESGVTIMRMVKALDAGAILSQQAYPLTDLITSGELANKLAEISGPQLLKVLDELENDNYFEKQQRHEEATFAPKIEVIDAQINWNQDGQKIHNLVRAMDPEPGAWCQMELKGKIKRVKLFDSNCHVLAENDLANMQPVSGQVIELTDQLTIGCSQGIISFKSIQIEGKPRIKVKSFAAGYRKEEIKFNLSMKSCE
jgi:methionyl-tRNA formyltransferase